MSLSLSFPSSAPWLAYSLVLDPTVTAPSVRQSNYSYCCIDSQLQRRVYANNGTAVAAAAAAELVTPRHVGLWSTYGITNPWYARLPCMLPLKTGARHRPVPRLRLHPLRPR